MATSSATDLWDTIAAEAEVESTLWGEALLSPAEWARLPVFSPLAAERYALGVETIYEGYLLHYGRPRLFAPADRDLALLLGDYLYAHGLVRVASLDDVGAVADLAELISLCASLRAEERDGDGVAWLGTAAVLGQRSPDLQAGRPALVARGDAEPLLGLARRAAGLERCERALVAHRRLVD